MRRLALLAGALALALVLPSCTRSAANHEELGDRAYSAGQYADALAEYQLGRRASPGNAKLLAKVGAAALHAEDFGLAAEAYRTLARRDRSLPSCAGSMRWVGNASISNALTAAAKAWHPEVGGLRDP